MGGSDENNPGIIGLSHLQGCFRAGGSGKFVAATRQNRRVLGTVNQNVNGAPHVPCAVKKRPLSQRNAVSNKIPSTHVHRPVTRKFVADMANKKQIKPGVIKKSVVPEPVPDESDDSTIIDLDNESDIPEFEQHVKAMMEEIDRMDEVEMEDVDQESFLDIDNCDKKNPLAVVEYIDDIYKFYRKSESTGCVAPNYIAQQDDVNERMRGILLDWLTEYGVPSSSIVDSEVRVDGLETLDYLDNLCQRERFTEQGDALTFKSEIDRSIRFSGLFDFYVSDFLYNLVQPHGY